MLLTVKWKTKYRFDVYTGEAVNAIVKYHYRRECQDGSLTALLCGEGGLVPSLEQIFLFGFKNQRIFGRNFYVWDYLREYNFYIS